MQLNTTEHELDRNNMGLVKDEHRDSGNDLAQSELDALASEITQSLGFRHSLPYGLVLAVLPESPEPELEASADDETVTMEVKDSDDGRDAFSEKAESVSPLSCAI
jgi:hypothetical protein